MTKSAAQYEALHRRAHAAGLAAGEKARVPVSVVGTPRNLLASVLGGDDGGFHTDKPVYLDTEVGICGFAWVNVVNGRSGFARWAKSTGRARATWGSRGVDVRVRAFGQSLVRKEAYAAAYAQVLREAGLEVYVGSRAD
jgi:hypothetical protein